MKVLIEYDDGKIVPLEEHLESCDRANNCHQLRYVEEVNRARRFYERSQAAEARVIQLEAENIEYRARVAELKGGLEEAKSGLEERRKLKAEIASLESLHSYCPSTAEDLRARVKELEELNNELCERIRELEARVKELEGALDGGSVRRVIELEEEKDLMASDIERLRVQLGAIVNADMELEGALEEERKKGNIAAELKETNRLIAEQNELHKNRNVTLKKKFE